MKPIEFPGSNVVFAKDQPEYLPLPACRRIPVNSNGEITTCWKLSWKERISILLHGKLWLSIWTFYNPLQPISLSIAKPDWVPGHIEIEKTIVNEYTK
jgi:hypothetical protein